jgi:hypothetical protein
MYRNLGVVVALWQFEISFLRDPSVTEIDAEVRAFVHNKQQQLAYRQKRWALGRERKVPFSGATRQRQSCQRWRTEEEYHVTRFTHWWTLLNKVLFSQMSPESWRLDSLVLGGTSQSTYHIVNQFLGVLAYSWYSSFWLSSVVVMVQESFYLK